MPTDEKQEQKNNKNLLGEGQALHSIYFEDGTEINTGVLGCESLVVHREELNGPAGMFVVDSRIDGSVFLHNFSSIGTMKLAGKPKELEDQTNADLIGRLENYIERGHDTDPRCLEDIRSRLIELAGFIEATCPSCEGSRKDERGNPCEICLGRGVITDKEVEYDLTKTEDAA